MKILLVDTSLKMGGAEVLVSNMMEIFRSKGHDVELAIFNGERTILFEKLEKSNFKIHVVGGGFKNVYDPRRIIKLRRLMKNFDIIHSNTSPAQIITSFASIGLHKRLITTEHNSNNRRRNKAIIKPIDKFVYKRYQTIVGCSEDATDALKLYMPLLSNRIITIKNGINAKKIQDATLSNDIPHWVDNQINLIMVGRFDYPKDQVTVIKAMKYLPDNIHVYFAGDGQNRQKSEELANDLGVVSRTHFLGLRGDIPELIKAADIAVHSSFWEGLPLSILEEMAADCPVVASDSKGISRIVDGAGLLFRTGDEKDLASMILRLLNDDQLYNETLVKCKERANEYDIERMCDKYLEYYCKEK